MVTDFTFEKLKTFTNAFDDFVTVSGSDLPEYYKTVFPSKCKCGSDIIMTSTTSRFGGYTQLQCCNPYCWVKMAHQFAYFMKTLGFRDFGEASAVTMYSYLGRELKSLTFLAIFEIENSQIASIMGDAYAARFAAAKDALKNRVFQFKDIIAALGIPDIGKGSRLFDLIKDPAVLCKYMAENKTDYLCDLAGIQSVMTRYHLNMARIDVLTLFVKVAPHVYSTPKNEVCVAITGSVSVDGKPVTRSEFIGICESIRDAKGSPLYKIVETKSQAKLDYVIADSPSTSSKYKLGQDLGILITADNFVTLLRDRVEQEVPNDTTEQ